MARYCIECGDPLNFTGKRCAPCRDERTPDVWEQISPHIERSKPRFRTIAQRVA